jgi:hypothetical protein
MRAAAITAGAVLMSLLGVFFAIALICDQSATESTQSCEGTAGGEGEPALLNFYVSAAARYRLGADGYAYLAAINYVETKFGTDLSTSTAGAVGWMQFEPSTFAKYGVSVSAPGSPPDPNDPQDAIYTAARYLAASGAPQDWSAAIFGYNHADWYVREVQGYAGDYSGANGLTHLSAAIATAWGNSPPSLSTYPAGASATPVSNQLTPTTTSSSTGATARTGAGTASAACVTGASSVDVAAVPGQETVIMPNGLARPPASAPEAVQAMVAAGDRIIDEPYSWGGGHCVAAMNQQTVDLNDCPGQMENGGAGFDCSSSTSYVLWGGGLASLIDNSPQVSDTFTGLGEPGPGKWVTFMASDGHVYIDVAGAFMNTENGEFLHDAPQPPTVASSTGPRWSTADNSLDSLTRPGFVPRHPAGL